MQEDEKMITICTQAYNAAPYLKQCVESVLNQTYKKFQFIIVDNGCNDGSEELLKQYAERDQRIILIRYEKNKLGTRWLDKLLELGTGEYVAYLDADDWWELNYLERLINFLQRNQLDLALTGTINYFEETKTHKLLRKLDTAVIMTQYDFAKYYPKFWMFPSTMWGCVAKMELYKKADFYAILQQAFVYGADTVTMLEYIKQCNYIGIDNTALYHYRIHTKSVSYAYNPARFDSNIGYYKLIREFLELHHVFDAQKRNWLKRVHISSLIATLSILKQANIEAKSKLVECTRIASHPLTTLALTAQGNERTQWIQLVQNIAMQAVSEINSKEEVDDIREYFIEKFPECGKAFSFEFLELFRKEPKMWNYLFQDYKDGMLACIREWIASAKYDTSVDLGSLMGQILPETSPLHGITDIAFFRKYAELCGFIFEEQYEKALDIANVYFADENFCVTEIFLQVYLNLACLLEEPSSFVMGNVHLAVLYYNQKQYEACKNIVNDLVEMGAGAYEEVVQLQKVLAEI